jgi:eukaryotic-like serine/threonine-protein kinase
MLPPEVSARENRSGGDGPTELVPGDALGRYQLLFPVGEGGMARVWLARLRGARGFDQLVAVKVLLPAYVGNQDFEQMFIDEARIASRISHAHVVKVLDMGEDLGHLYIVLEWLEGADLAALMRRVRRRERLPIPIAVRLIAQACAGLHATHQLRDQADALLGVVHGDVSPQNLVVTYDGSVKLIDFGVASTSLGESALTGKFIAGKRSYMAPEQRRGEELDRRTDVYALGVVLYKLTTGVHPFQGARSEPADSAVWTRPALPPRAQDPDYPPELEAIVVRTLALDPSERMKSADELAKALEALPHQYRSATDEDVAQHIRQLFAHERLELRNRIEAALARAVLPTPVPGRERPPGPSADDARSALTSLVPWEATQAADPGRRRHSPKLFYGAAAAFGIVLLVFGLRPAQQPEPAHSPAARAPASAVLPATSESSGRADSVAPAASDRSPTAAGRTVPRVRGPLPVAAAKPEPARSASPPPSEPPSLGPDVPKNWRHDPGF